MKVNNIGSQGDNAGAGFVAEGEGFEHGDVAVAEVGEVVEVGAAEAGGEDGDLDFAGGGGREGAGCLRRAWVSWFWVLDINDVVLGGGYLLRVRAEMREEKERG